MWESIYCSRKVAYGCGRHGQKLVDGLHPRRRGGPEHQGGSRPRPRPPQRDKGPVLRQDRERGTPRPHRQLRRRRPQRSRLLPLRLHRRVALHDPPPAESPRGLLHVVARPPAHRRRRPPAGAHGAYVPVLLARRRGLPLPVHSGGVDWHHRPAVGYKDAAIPGSS
ncbi:hypothetical protein GQ55_9G052000 [Panicum hallii var. hallii]|uniref:Uncharacterized protein n=1 Tax=Panicum hallii var. hallii TaxID=1504633 RepID=A0A2T7C053_9POAL|nr:hypothetical protein GQ55_9G052000 [Panicum hallii var. hallii]